jgi:hypothetical protein
VGAFADKVAHLLGDCGDEALDAVAGGFPVRSGVAQVSASSSNAEPPTRPGGRTAPKPLSSLTVEEVGRALAGLGLNKLVPVFAANEVTGNLLANCEEAGDLMTEDFGVGSKPVAKVLMAKIEEWRAQGVSEL